MNKDNEDLNIFQHGGCGGLYFFYQLLLTNKFNCVLDTEISYLEAKNFVFDIKNPDDWKNTEIFPDNNRTLQLKNNSNRIFYTVNDFRSWMKLPGKKILVYTDARSQLRLNWYKRTYWFWKTEKTYIFFYKIAKGILKNKKGLYDKPVYVAMTRADLMVKFQNLLTVESLEKELKNFGCDITQDNVDFLNHYLSLHSPKLLRKLGVELL
jgi:hypothetical protein